MAKSSSLNVSLLYISVFVVVIDEQLKEENKIFRELGIQAARLLEGFYYIIISKKELWIYLLIMSISNLVHSKNLIYLII